MAAIQWWLFINKFSSRLKCLKITGSECGLCFQVFLLSWFVPCVLMPEAVTLFLHVKPLQLPSHSTPRVITHNSHSVSLCHWGWSIVDMISHQFSTEVRNIVHGLNVPNLKPLLWKDTVQGLNLCICKGFVNIWSSNDFNKQTKQNKTHYKNMLEERCSNGHWQIWWQSSIDSATKQNFHWRLKKYGVTLNHSLRLLTRLYKYNKYTKHFELLL